METFIDKTIAGRYRCMEKIGTGGMGVVYLADDAVLKRKVVLKTIILTAKEEKAAARFLREAKIMSQLNHPHIVTIHDFGKWEGMMYIIMEYLQGKTLETFIEEESPLPTPWIINALTQIMDALEAAHDAGIIHRDLKPSNIFCLPPAKPGQKEFIKILDFGTAISMDKDTYERVTTMGEVMGTPHYMSPEQIMGKDISQGSDIYSLGVILYEMLTGTPPFTSENTMTILLAHLYKTPEPLTVKTADAYDDPRRQRLVEMVNVCLNKNPAERYDSIRELRKALTEDRKNTARLIESLANDRQKRFKQFYQGAVDDTRPGEETIHPSPLRDTRLWVVEAEDNPVEQSIMPLLRIANYSVESPSFQDWDRDVPETADLPDILILNKGKEDNLAFIEEIQSITKWKTVPYLVCGPEGDLDYISRTIEAGAGDYLSYPFDPKEIQKKIDRLSH